MGLVDYLDKKKGMHPSFQQGSEDEDVPTGANPDSGMNEGQGTDIIPKVDTPAIQKPEWMTDDDYSAATSILPPDRVQQLYGKFDPNSAEPFYEKLYKSIKKDPEYDEKKERAARSMGSIGDALSLLAQIAGGGGEGLIERRGPDKLPSAGTNKMIEEWKERYRKDRDTYDAGLMSSRLNDIQQARADYQNDRNSMLSVIFNDRKQRVDDERFRIGKEFEKEKFEWGKEVKEKEFQLRERGMKAEEAHRAAILQVQKERLEFQRGKAFDKGNADFYDPRTNTGYFISKDKWNRNYPQFKNILLNDPNLDTIERLRLQNAKGKELEEIIKSTMYSNPDAMDLLRKISDNTVSYGGSSDTWDDKNEGNDSSDYFGGFFGGNGSSFNLGGKTNDTGNLTTGGEPIREESVDRAKDYPTVNTSPVNGVNRTIDTSKYDKVNPELVEDYRGSAEELLQYLGSEGRVSIIKSLMDNPSKTFDVYNVLLMMPDAMSAAKKLSNPDFRNDKVLKPFFEKAQSIADKINIVAEKRKILDQERDEVLSVSKDLKRKSDIKRSAPGLSIFLSGR